MVNRESTPPIYDADTHEEDPETTNASQSDTDDDDEEHFMERNEQLIEDNRHHLSMSLASKYESQDVEMVEGVQRLVSSEWQVHDCK